MVDVIDIRMEGAVLLIKCPPFIFIPTTISTDTPKFEKQGPNYEWSLHVLLQHVDINAR